MIKRKSHPVCPFCKSDETIPLTNYGKQINNHFQCLDCKKQWCNKCKQRRVDCECGKVLKRKNPYRKDETNNGLNLEKYRKSYDKGYLQGLINGLQKLDYITWPAINHSSIVSRPVIFLGLGAIATNDGTVPCYISPADSFTVFVLLGGTVISGLNSQPIIEIGENSQCILRLQNGASIDSTAITGPNSATIIIQHDGETKFSTLGIIFSGFSGTYLNQPLGTIGGRTYYI